MSETSRIPRKWVSDKFLSDYYQVSRVTIWNWAKSGKLPPPQKIGDNTTRSDFQKILAAEQAA
jgi:predicted DNA-binding transcriptional regulator AlpA